MRVKKESWVFLVFLSVALAVPFYVLYLWVNIGAIILLIILTVIFFVLYKLGVRVKTLGLLETFVLIFLVFFISISFFTLDIRTVSAESVVVRGAHRGNSVDYIENTLPAFQSAIDEDKYKFIEFDVQYTKDKKLIVHHGEVVIFNSLPGILVQSTDYPVRDLTYKELLDVSDYHIPLYEEVMNLIGGVKPVNIEIKSQKNKEDDRRVADFIIADAKKRGIIDSIMISSISSDVLKYIKDQYPEVKTGKIYWLEPSTFLHADFLTSLLYKEVEKTKSNYILLHGSNLRNYKSIYDLLPEDTTLIIWYYTLDDKRNDEIYVVDPKPHGWLYGLQKVSKKLHLSPPKEPCLWWC